MTHIDTRQLKIIQQIQVEILEKFHKICIDNNLTYMIYSGTMLGQVRHDGFIPWDDDIDVAMSREDYDKLLKISGKFPTCDLFLQHKSTDSNFPHHFIRIRANNTLMLQEEFKDIDMHHGVFIDVFPLDYLPQNKILYKWFLSKVNFHKKLRIFLITEQKSALRKTIKSILSAISSDYYFHLSEKDRKKYNDSKYKSEWFADLTLDVDKETIRKFKVHVNEYTSREIVKFERIDVITSKYSDIILKRSFGDYEVFPPVEMRIPHHGVIEFQDYRK